MECIADTEISEGDKLMLYTRIISLERIQKNTPNLDFGCKKRYKSRNYLIYTLCCGEGLGSPCGLCIPLVLAVGPLQNYCSLCAGGTQWLFYIFSVEPEY